MKLDDLDQGQTHLRVLPGRHGTSQEKMDSAKILLHTHADGAWIIPSQDPDVWNS